MLMLGDVLARLDRPEVAEAVLRTLEPALAAEVTRRAESHAMSAPDFTAGAIREFMEYADDDQWSQLMTQLRKAEEPGLTAVRVILEMVVAS